jgi:hypothetical protein
MCRRWRQEVKQVAIGSLTNETEYGDASACLCLSHPVDPTRPAALTSNGVPRRHDAGIGADGRSVHTGRS